MSNVLAATPVSVDAATKPERPRYALKVHPDGFIGGIIGIHHYLFVPDLHSAHHWESVEAVHEWLGGVGGKQAARLADKPLFVVQARFVRERIVAAWTLTAPIAEPVAEASKP